ncbi:MAG: glycoside hydrolase [Gammaproteobacteria bacterium]|nr:glycoside hydrolase [Gammaproteobacteria bacterium]
MAQAASVKCALAPSAVFDASGRLWLAWAYGGHVYVNYSDDKGKSFSPALAVNRIAEEISARGENRPKIALDQKGAIYVSWTMPLEKRFTGHIRFSYSTDGGYHFSEPVIVNDNWDVTGHRFDALGVNRQGDVYIAWLDKRDRFKAAKSGEKYHGAAVYFSWSDDGGKSFKPDKKIIDHSCECCRVIIDFDEKDLPVILWRNIYGKDVRDHAIVNFLSKDTPAKPQRVSFDEWHIDACPHHGPDMSINDNGDYHLVWFNNAAARHGLFYARHDQASNRMIEAVQFGDFSKAASHATVIHRENTVWLAWKQFDGKEESVWLQKSTDNGDSWQQAEKIAVTAGSADYPFLIRDKDQVYLQWQTEVEGFRLISVN